MSFQRVGLKQEDMHAYTRDRLQAAITYEPERSMSNGRLTGSILSWLLGIAAIYGCVFYVPAFVDMGKVLGTSTENLKLPAVTPEDEKHILAAYIKPFKIRRGFVRQGQALKINYALSPGTNMVISFKKCDAPVFVEVFHCKNTQPQQVLIENPGHGARSFVMREAGFYYFDEAVINPDGSLSEKPHKIVWSRKDLGAAKKKMAAR